MSLTMIEVKDIFDNSQLFCRKIEFKGIDKKPETILFRLLSTNDFGKVLEFFNNLSEETRRFATYPSYDELCANQFCEDVGRQDIVRFIALNESSQIVGIFELNFTLSQFDIDRFRSYGIELNSETDVQLAPCLRDDYQNGGLATELIRQTVEFLKILKKRRVIAWAGVLTDNHRALRFYEKNHFQIFHRSFIAEDGYECFDGILDLICFSN